jgi:hypothetical protein
MNPSNRTFWFSAVVLAAGGNVHGLIVTMMILAIVAITLVTR